MAVKSCVHYIVYYTWSSTTILINRQLGAAARAIGLIGAANRQPCAAAASLARHAAGRVLTLQVSHMEAQAAVAAGAVILDVRRADEFEKRHIDGAVNIPLMGLAEAIQAPSSPLLLDDGSPRPVVVHCASGARSAAAAAELGAAGFTSVIDLGAMDNWEGEGLPAAVPRKMIKCDGCGAVMQESEFQAHCGEEELHDDEFMYTYTEVKEAAVCPVVATTTTVETTEKAGGAVELAFTGAGGGDDSAAWQTLLPSVPLDPPNPCRNWMGNWEAPCDRLCCHTHPSNCPCADIGCDGCGYSIVRPDGATTVSMNGLEPGVRFVCLECPADTNYDKEHWGTQLCQPCFASCAIGPHFGADGTTLHNRWLQISSTGEHSVVQRATDGMVVAEIKIGDLASDTETGECPGCWDDYSDENPRSSLPGCTVEAHMLCSQCAMRALSAAGKLRFVKQDDGALPPATYFCKRCEDDDRKRLEVASVLRELEVLLASGTCELAGAVHQLKTAHALKPNTDVNKHLHAALDGHVAKAAAEAPAAAGAAGGGGGGGEVAAPAPEAPAAADDLPYGGDIQAAMRATDRDAIRQIMAARNK